MNAAEQRQFVPLSKVVKASIIDTYEDIGKMQERYFHWCKRGLDELEVQVLKHTVRHAFLIVNHNTNTATLPLDFTEEIFVGVVDNRWMKIPLALNSNLVHVHSVYDVDAEKKCDKCGQEKSICEDLKITETTNLIVINDATYEQRLVKKLYPNGDYYLETTTPYLNIDGVTIDYNTSKEFISHFDLKPCGCLDTTESNITNLQTHCPDCYCCYYAGCDSGCKTDFGSYKVFPENGVIQFDKAFKFDKAYIEYRSTIPKVNGEYHVPKVAFETLVEWSKYRAVEGKSNISNPDKRFRKDAYITARRNMEKILGRFSLSAIVDASTRIPKFDTTYQDWYSYFNWDAQVAAVTAAAADTSTSTSSNSSTVITITNTVTETVPKGRVVNGLSLNSLNQYFNTEWAGWDLLIFYNGLNRYLLSNEYEVFPQGGFGLLTGITYTSDDNFITTTNGRTA